VSLLLQRAVMWDASVVAKRAVVDTEMAALYTGEKTAGKTAGAATATTAIERVCTRTRQTAVQVTGNKAARETRKGATNTVCQEGFDRAVESAAARVFPKSAWPGCETCF
jgi:hypothetical protein